MPMRRAEDGVGMDKAVRAYVYPTWLTKESRKSWEHVTQGDPVLTNAREHVARARGQTATTTAPHGIKECIMSPAKRDAKKQVKARQRRRLQAQERLARDRRQAQHAAKVLEQALQDLGPPRNLGSRDRRAFAGSKKAFGQNRWHDDVSSPLRLPHERRTVPRAGVR